MHITMFIFGFGYTAEFFAKNLSVMNAQIIGTTRDTENLGVDQRTGVERIDFDDSRLEQRLKYATHVLISTPPNTDVGDPVLHRYRDALKKHAKNIQWVGYLSSTSVYGDHQGRWVTELSKPIALGRQGQLRLDAERAWLAFATTHQLPLHIFRIAGIYGPQRNALTQLSTGTSKPIYKEGHFFSRIHVEDIANILLASIQKPNPLSIYNVADDEPAPSYDIIRYAAHLLNRPTPQFTPFEHATLSPMAQEFYTHHRRVSNAKVIQELNVTLKYPTYREGLTQLL